MGLRELNQNPSKAVARVRAGASIVITDRGKPVMRLVPEVESDGPLARMIASGEVTPPANQGIPEVIPELSAEPESLSELLVADRDQERRR